MLTATIKSNSCVLYYWDTATNILQLPLVQLRGKNVEQLRHYHITTALESYIGVSNKQYYFCYKPCNRLKTLFSCCHFSSQIHIPKLSIFLRIPFTPPTRYNSQLRLNHMYLTVIKYPLTPTLSGTLKSVKAERFSQRAKGIAKHLMSNFKQSFQKAQVHYSF